MGFSGLPSLLALAGLLGFVALRFVFGVFAWARSGTPGAPFWVVSASAAVPWGQSKFVGPSPRPSPGQICVVLRSPRSAKKSARS